jgi:hypothetical protein
VNRPIRPESGGSIDLSRPHDHTGPLSAQFRSLAAYLDDCRRRRTTVTYLQAADAISVCPPQRIHQVTQLLEALVDYDHQRGKPLRAALVVSRSRIVSRSRTCLPAEGFFLKVQRLGLITGSSNEEFHQYCLSRLFDD